MKRLIVYLPVRLTKPQYRAVRKSRRVDETMSDVVRRLLATGIRFERYTAYDGAEPPKTHSQTEGVRYCVSGLSRLRGE
jgi:hypothetical protein